MADMSTPQPPVVIEPGHTYGTVTNKISAIVLTRPRLLALALVRLLEIIGEAAGRVPAEEQARRPGVPWPSIVGLRNRLIHGYDDIDHDIRWQIATADLPALLVQLSE
jgi:uncharacterized protein with HEPN domain